MTFHTKKERKEWEIRFASTLGECVSQEDKRKEKRNISDKEEEGIGLYWYSSYFLLQNRSPDDSKIKQKMLYASSKDALRKSLVGISSEIQGTDMSEVAHETGEWEQNEDCEMGKDVIPGNRVNEDGFFFLPVLEKVSRATF